MMMQSTLRFLLFSALLSAFAQVPFIIGPSEVSSVKKTSFETLKSPTTLKEAYYSTKALTALNLTDYKCSCSAISKLLSVAESAADMFFGIASASSCGCGPIELSSSAKAKIKSDLKSDELDVFAGAALAAKASGEKLSGMKDVVGKIKSLMEPDGTFRSSVDGTTSSIDNTRLALEVLESYADSSTKFIVSEIIETATKLLPSGDDDDIVDPLLLPYLVKLQQEGGKVRLSAAQITAISQSLLNLYQSNNIYTTAKALEGLSMIKSLYNTQPLYISLSKSSFDFNDRQKTTTIEVSDIFGNPVETTAVEIKSVRRVIAGSKSESSNIFSGKLEPSEGSFVLDLSTSQIVPGVYTVKIGVNAMGRKATITTERNIVISASAKISNVYFGVTDSRTFHSADLSQVKAEESLSGVTASSQSADYIHVTFSLSCQKPPHQVFLKFTHLASSTHTFFVGQEDTSSSSSSSEREYRVTVSIADEIETFLWHSGEYSLQIIVGDAAISPIQFTLGDISVSLSPKPKKDYPLYVKSLLHDSDTTLKPLPEISHRMRGPPKRASAFMSSIFTASVLVPLVVFVLFLLSLKPNLNRLKSLFSILYIGVIGTALALYAAYWLAVKGVSFYDTIKYICLLLPVLLLVSRYALASVTLVRLAENKKE